MDSRGDIYGLGATLYFLLTGRPPFVEDDPAKFFALVRDSEPISLQTLRPDLPPELIGLVAQMMDKDPNRRPATAFDVESTLISFCRPGTVPAQPMPVVVPMATPTSGVAFVDPVPEAAPAEEPADAWGVDPGTLAISQDTSDRPPRKRFATAAEKKRTRLLLLLGGLLHLTGIGLAIAWALGAFKSPPVPETTPPTQKQDEPHKTPKKQRQNPPS
jgi:serine/threonine protein kinase